MSLLDELTFRLEQTSAQVSLSRLVRTESPRECFAFTIGTRIQVIELILSPDMSTEDTTPTEHAVYLS